MPDRLGTEPERHPDDLDPLADVRHPSKVRQQKAADGFKAFALDFDAKAVADLQARLQAEQAFLQIDVLRMEALRMVQQAQAQVDEQRKVEDWRHRMDAMKAALQ